MQKLTPEFNKATVNKGDEFQIVMFMPGCVVSKRQDVEVVSGHAELLSDIIDSTPPKGALMWSDKRILTFKAKEAGEVNIVAHGDAMQQRQTFKINVK